MPLALRHTTQKVSYPVDNELAVKCLVRQEAILADLVKLKSVDTGGLPTQHDVRNRVQFVLELKRDKTKQSAARNIARDLPLLFREPLDLVNWIRNAESLDRAPHNLRVRTVVADLPRQKNLERGKSATTV